MTTTIAAARKHGKFPGFGGVYDEALTRSFIAMGMRFVLGGGDLPMFMAAATARAKFLRELPLK